MHFLLRIHTILNQHDFGCHVKKKYFIFLQTTNNKQASKSANSLAHEHAFANFSEPVVEGATMLFDKPSVHYECWFPGPWTFVFQKKCNVIQTFTLTKGGFLAALKPNSNSVHWCVKRCVTV